MKETLLPLVVFIVIASAIFAWLTMTSKRSADVLVVNAKVYTVDSRSTIAEAVAIRGSRIVAVGKTDDISKRYASQSVIDAKGKFLFPGFIDSHVHVAGYGASLFELNLVGTKSAEEILRMVAAKVATLKPGQWIRGRGWDQNDWKSKGNTKPFPDAAMLDQFAPLNPVFLARVDGHAVWVNSRAMEMAGLLPKKSADEYNVDGGRILLNAKGEPTGIFIDNAIDRVATVLPAYTKEESQEAISLAVHEFIKAGLTSVHDMGIGGEEFALYKEMSLHQQLPVRVYAAVGGDGPLWKSMMACGPYSDGASQHFTVRAVKMYIDGALGSRGAALIEPYSDEPDNRGLTVTTFEHIRAMAEEALAHGFQICTHAIGDRGNNIVLNAYEEALKKFPDKARDARFRIEHAQVLQPSDIPRFKQLGIIPSMQPTHCTSDMYWAQARLGPVRILGAYAWHSLLEDGNHIASGSDAPVENPNPLPGFYAAITRQDTVGIPRNAEDVAKYFQLSADGIKDSSYFDGGWYPAQHMTREEALRSFTIWGAEAEFAEHQKGSIEPGKLADLVLLSDDIMTIPPKEILKAKVVMTIVGGKIVYEEGK
ncbi:MAG: amidohydrolase [Bacteroidota bacterium]|nr:amidohydrolase [Bacteroidota bacterium]